MASTNRTPNDLANSLAHTHPEVARWWVVDVDGRRADQVTAGSHYRALWACPDCDYRSRTRVRNRVSGGAGCHSCGGRVATAQTCLATRRPAVAAEWLSHPRGGVELWYGPVNVFAFLGFHSRRMTSHVTWDLPPFNSVACMLPIALGFDQPWLLKVRWLPTRAGLHPHASRSP